MSVKTSDEGWRVVAHGAALQVLYGAVKFCAQQGTLADIGRRGAVCDAQILKLLRRTGACVLTPIAACRMELCCFGSCWAGL